MHNLNQRDLNTILRQSGNDSLYLCDIYAYHNVINTSKTAKLKLYTRYSPPNHPDKTVHKTKADAEKAEAAKHQPKPQTARRSG